MNEVREVPDRTRYEILVDGTVAGYLLYNVRGGRMILVHTEIDDAYAGRGLGGELVAGALADARVRGMRVVPVCPFVERFVEQHPEYDDLVDHDLFAAINRERERDRGRG